MEDLSPEFSNEAEMLRVYRGFLEGFAARPGRLVLVEEDSGAWMSAPRP